MKKLLVILCCLTLGAFSFGDYKSELAAKKWADSVFVTLTEQEKIAQLMVIRAHSNLGDEHISQVTELITKYNVGALCFFQGGPVRQANLTNYYQSIAKTPLMITIDGEWGLGMRLDSIVNFPYQLTLGALPDDRVIYDMGVAVGKQMRRMGVHVNYAPVVDINNNPANPVIGYRSFGEDKNKVASYGVAYMRGMQDAGIMATAKHFPGHGDVDVDSHYDLPLITKSRRELDTLELYPFRQLFRHGAASVMIAHLAIPALDKTLNKPTSLSKKSVTDLLRDDMDFNGLVFTDALEMKGVSKFYPAGEAAVQALIAGNDMLCLPEDVPLAIEAVQQAIKKKRLKWKSIDERVVKVLRSKYRLGLGQPQHIDTTNLVEDLNSGTNIIRDQVARNTITVMNNRVGFLPMITHRRIAYIAIGQDGENLMGRRMRDEMKADIYYVPYNSNGTMNTVLSEVRRGGYDKIIIGIHGYNMRPPNNYGISNAALGFWNSLQSLNAATFVFGNVYAAQNFCNASTLVAMYQDDDITQDAAVDFLQGKLAARGRLPVSVCNVQYGQGTLVNRFIPTGFSPAWLKIDSIMNDGIRKKAFPGGVVLALHKGEVKYHKAFGRYDYNGNSPVVSLESIYDLASVTKTSATTVALMKLFEEGKLKLDNTLGHYLPYTRGTDKEYLTIRNILLHEAGLSASISFYRETIDPRNGSPFPGIYSSQPNALYTIPVARNIWLRHDWTDTMMQRVVSSRLGPAGKYVYSDNDFILLAKVVEAITGTTLDQYVYRNFYAPLGMYTTGFNPWKRLGTERVVPTEEETYFRKQLLRGYVHDEGAAMFGGVAGHAGLFSNAYDLSILYQMLLNEGTLHGVKFLNPETIRLFTSYGSHISRRGLGFDKPEKDNLTRKEPYPAAQASELTYGHTGFTGTAVWVDPESEVVYIFLSNRVINSRSNLLARMNIRGKVFDAIYDAVRSETVK